MIDIKEVGKGGLIKPLSIRDYRLETLPAGAVLDLPSKFSLRDKIGKIKNQNGSLSCVAQATAYYLQLLNYIETGKQIELSARDIYSLIFIKDSGGSYIKDAFSKACNSGCVEELLATSYMGLNKMPPTEEFMRNRTDITQEAMDKGMDYLASKYITWDNVKPELYEKAIYKGNGCVVVSWGNNDIWQTKDIQLPSFRSQMVWRHGIYIIGFDREKRMFEFVNSWGEEWGDKGFGYLPYDYITQGYVSNPMTLVDLPNETWTKIMSSWYNLKKMFDEFIKQRSLKVKPI